MAESEDFRAWWKLEDDGYLYDNVCRHLAGAGLIGELEAVLCDVRWIH